MASKPARATRTAESSKGTSIAFASSVRTARTPPQKTTVPKGNDAGATPASKSDSAPQNDPDTAYEGIILQKGPVSFSREGIKPTPDHTSDKETHAGCGTDPVAVAEQLVQVALHQVHEWFEAACKATESEVVIGKASIESLGLSLQHARNHLLKAASPLQCDHVTPSSRIDTIETDIKHIKEAVDTLTTATHQTWAQIAATPAKVQPQIADSEGPEKTKRELEEAKYERRQKLKEQREKTEVALSFGESPNARAEEVKAMTEEAIAEYLQNSIDEDMMSGSSPCPIKILGVNKISKWNIKVICSTPEEATKLRMLDWKSLLGATLATPVYGVVIHGVAKKDISPTINDSENKAKVISDLEALNPIKITHLAPLMRKPQNQEAPTHSVIIFMDDPSQADQLILRGIRIGNQKRNRCYSTERYVPRSQLMQCFNCQGFGHKAEGCTRPQKCGKCAEEHQTKACSKPTQKCALCNGSHQAWNEECPRRQDEIQRLKYLRASVRPTFNP